MEADGQLSAVRSLGDACAESADVARAWIAIRRIALGTATTVGLACLLLATSARAADFAGRVVRVHDGDTLTVLVDRRQVRVRLVDIDAPELRQAFGRRSRDSLAALCAGMVALVQEAGKDRYARTLGRVTCGAVDVNSEQVRLGMAWVYVRYALKASPLYDLQSAARLERAGLWADAHPVPPWEWRHKPPDGARRRPEL